jgi:hypothetical protein
MNAVNQSLQIPAAGVVLEADVVVPEPPRALVLFAHGSGSGRHSPRNRRVAGELQGAGLATVLADLLTPQEEQVDARTGALRFDIGLLSERVAALTDWLVGQERFADLGVGLFPLFPPPPPPPPPLPPPPPPPPPPAARLGGGSRLPRGSTGSGRRAPSPGAPAHPDDRGGA